LLRTFQTPCVSVVISFFFTLKKEVREATQLLQVQQQLP
jgi:hypothetical protein